MKKVLLPAVLALGLFGATLTGHAATFENYTTGIQGKILSVGVHNATTNQWYDFAVNQDINNIGQTLSGQINVSQLAPGTYDRIRYGHEKFKIQGKVVLKDDANGRNGEYVTTGEWKSYANVIDNPGEQPHPVSGPAFKKGGALGWLELPTNKGITEKMILSPNPDSDEYKTVSPFDKEGVAGYQEGGIDYEMTAISFVVSEKDGKKVAEGAYKTNIAFDTRGLWSGAGWPGSPNRYTPSITADPSPRGEDKAEYAYIHNGDTDSYTWQKRDDGEYLFPTYLDKPEIDLEKNNK